MTWVLATAGALLLGILTNFVYDLVKNQGGKLPARFDRRSLPPAARRYDSTQDGLTALVTWSRSRRLSQESLVTAFAGRLSRPHLMAGETWDAEVARLVAEGKAGRTAYISALQVDTYEHEHARKFRVTIAESSYAEALAASHLYRMDDWAARVSEGLARGLTSFVPVAPPSSLTVSVSVLSAENRILALRRSLSVQTYPGQWTVGINETMKYDDEPGAAEDFFALTYRGLKEELGLDRGDYGPVVLSWLGWSHRAVCWVLVAVVRSTLTSGEIDERRSNCHSVYEHDAIRWLPFTRTEIAKIVTGEGKGPWSYLAPLLAVETWRNRDSL